MKNNDLAIAIPTHNRSGILYENLLLMLDEIKKFSIPVYISDNSTNDETEGLVAEIKAKYEYVYYRKNIPPVEVDLNTIKTLSIPDEKYVWFLGDSWIIKLGGIEGILKVINSGDFDFISVNTDDRDLDIPTRVFEDGNEMLRKLGWHLTLAGATIYSQKSLKDMKHMDLKKCERFAQTAIIFNRFSMVVTKLYWLNDRMLTCNVKKVSGWKRQVFQVFLYDWNYFITNLSDYYRLESKQACVVEHSFRTGLFSLKRLLVYRAEGSFDLSILRNYFQLLKENSRVKAPFLLLIAVFPQWLMKIVIVFSKKIRDFLRTNVR